MLYPGGLCYVVSMQAFTCYLKVCNNNLLAFREYCPQGFDMLQLLESEKLPSSLPFTLFQAITPLI